MAIFKRKVVQVADPNLMQQPQMQQPRQEPQPPRPQFAQPIQPVIPPAPPNPQFETEQMREPEAVADELQEEFEEMRQQSQPNVVPLNQYQQKRTVPIPPNQRQAVDPREQIMGDLNEYRQTLIYSPESFINPDTKNKVDAEVCNLLWHIFQELKRIREIAEKQ